MKWLVKWDVYEKQVRLAWFYEKWFYFMKNVLKNVFFVKNGLFIRYQYINIISNYFI